MTSLFPPFDRRTSFRKQPFFYEAGRGVHTRGSAQGQTLNLNFTTGVLDPRVTFSRPSNATLYDSTGKLTYAPTNLLTYSEQFDNAAWVASSLTVTANQTTAPDGTLTADLCVPSATLDGFKELRQNANLTQNVIYVYSQYVKSAGYNFVSIIGSGASFGTFYVNFDILTGVETAFSAGTSTVIGRGIQDIGNGWYKVYAAVQCLSTSSGRMAINTIPDGTSARGTAWSGNGVSGVYYWGAQLETVTYQTTPRTYTATTSAAYYGPRFDYNPTTLAANGLLIEEARTNLTTYSDQFNNAAWTKVNASITANSATSPDGTLSADTLISNTSPTYHVVVGSVGTVSSGVAYTQSVYAKAAGYSWIRMSFGDVAGGGFAFFDVLNGVVGTVSGGTGNIVNVGNGWFRCSFTRTTAAAGALSNDIYAQSADNEFVWAGNGTSGVYIWGAQLEAGSFATSYIPTAASAAARSADTMGMTGANFSSWYNLNEGTFVSQVNLNSTFGLILSASDASFNNRLPQMAKNVANRLESYAIAAGSTVGTAIPSGAGTPGTFVSVATAYKLNDFAASCNGTLAVSGLTPLPTGISTLNIAGAYPSGSSNLNGNIKSLQYYNKRLPNATLQSLTT